jgi:hypothetical protein
MLRRSAAVVFAFLAVTGTAAAQPAMGPEFRVNSYTTGNQYNSAVAAHEDGNFVVAWSSVGQDGDVAGIFGQRFDVHGNPLGAEFGVPSYTTGNQFGPAMAVDASGGFVVVWSDAGRDGSSAGVFGQRYSPSGAPQGGDFQVNATTFSAQYQADVAFHPAGGFVVVWQSYFQDGNRSGIFGRLLDGVGTPSDFQVNTYTTSQQLTPAVAASAAGFVVVWSSLQGTGGYDVFAQRYDGTGNPLGFEFRVNTHTPDFQIAPDVAADAAGNFVVVWTSRDQDGSDYGIFGQRFDAAGIPAGPEFGVNAYATGRQWLPAVAREAGGAFMVTWTTVDSYALEKVVGQRFDANGTKVGEEFRVNTFTTGSQRVSAIAARGGEKFVVTWTSIPQDGSDSGVYGQLFGDLIFRDGFDAGP